MATPAQTVDTLLHARWVIPVEPERACLEHHSVAIAAGRIVDILPSAAARARYTARESIELPQHALIPGLINAHTHAAMSLFRGLADDLPLMDWLTKHMWPAEARWLSPEFDDRQVSKRAAGAGVEVANLSRYCIQTRRRPGLVFGFGAFDEQALDASAQSLARVMDDLGRTCQRKQGRGASINSPMEFPPQSTRSAITVA